MQGRRHTACMVHGPVLAKWEDTLSGECCTFCDSVPNPA